jgi:hypothetical protein
MIVKASRSALILVTGLLVCLACPSRAATAADDAAPNPNAENAAAAPVKLHKYVRHGSHHSKSYAHARFHRVGSKLAEDRKAAATDVASDNSAALPDLPPSVANAYATAQLPFPVTPGGAVGAMAARANDLLQATPDNPVEAKAGNETQVVAADQLNDVDRSLRETNAPAANTEVAAANPPAAPVTASSQENSTWDETSLIGKIFIGFGALLTMASAARMFMA